MRNRVEHKALNPLAAQWEDPESLAAAEAERQAAIKADKLAALEALLWPPPKGATPAQGAHSGTHKSPCKLIRRLCTNSTSGNHSVRSSC